MDIQLSLSHLGYLPESPKILTLLPGDASGLPDAIPFYLRQNCLRMARDATAAGRFFGALPRPVRSAARQTCPGLWNRAVLSGRIAKNLEPLGCDVAGGFQPASTRPAVIRSKPTGRSLLRSPFANRIYDRIIAGYLTFLRAQRCGCAVFGVHDACHLDDGILDTDGSPLQATGGWHDAGDFRKWLAFTLYHVEALLTMRERLGEDLERGGDRTDSLLDEVSWGNAYFHRMIDSAWTGL